MDHAARRDRLRKVMAQGGVDALLITNFLNVTYLTGFSGDDSYLLIHRGGEVILSDPRYTTQLQEESPDLDLHIRQPGVGIHQSVVKVLKWAKVTRLAIEADSMTVTVRNRIADKLPKMEIVATSGLVESLRQIKDKEEIAAIRQAIWYAERAFGVVRAKLRGDQTEKQIADELEYQMRLFGAKQSAFPSIVGVGPRAALPHAVPSQRRVAESDFVLIDWGARGALYHSDLTRVLITGKISPKLERVYHVVLEAQARAIAAMRPGVSAAEVDFAARDCIAQAGYGRCFGHGLGHGVGLEIHESPRMAEKAAALLKPGMVITVEPGIYLPGWGGVRIEDDVLITRKGCEVLTNVGKQFDEIIVH